MPHHLSADQLANLDLREERGQNPQFAVIALARAVYNFYYHQLVTAALVAGGSASREKAAGLVERLPDHASLDQLLGARATAQGK